MTDSVVAFIQGRPVYRADWKPPAVDVRPAAAARDANPGDRPLDAERDFEGFDPFAPCDAKPGSALKEAVLAARYAAGAPLFVDGDAEHDDDFEMGKKELAADVDEIEEEP